MLFVSLSVHILVFPPKCKWPPPAISEPAGLNGYPWKAVAEGWGEALACVTFLPCCQGMNAVDSSSEGATGTNGAGKEATEATAVTEQGAQGIESGNSSLSFSLEEQRRRKVDRSNIGTQREKQEKSLLKKHRTLSSPCSQEEVRHRTENGGHSPSTGDRKAAYFLPPGVVGRRGPKCQDHLLFKGNYHTSLSVEASFIYREQMNSMHSMQLSGLKHKLRFCLT